MIVLEPATAADAQALSDFAADAFTATFGPIYDPADLALFLSTWNPPDRFGAQIADPDWAITLARDGGGAILGYIKMGPLEFDLPPDQPTDDAVELHQIYLSQAAKGTGLATALMDWGIAWARARASILYLSVFIDNARAQAVYRRYGFTDVGRNQFRVGNHIDEDRFFPARPMSIPFVRSAALAGVPHGFFGRRGGVSTGERASLNCGLGSGDDPALIAENRRRVADAALPGATLAGLYQVHGNRCILVDQASDLAARPEADALATRTPGILLGILTADCVPVLLADRAAGVVGAAHAGWKGALAGVTDTALAAMETLGAHRADISVAIGPCIARASYEVDDGFVQRFAADDPANERFFAAGKPGHAMFDIAAYVAARLAAAGVTQIAIGGQDTYAEPQDYFSYRRACHKGENSYGRQLSVIGLARPASG